MMLSKIPYCLLVVFILTACGPGGGIDLRTFHAGVDGSVECEGFPNLLSDIGISVDSSNVMTVVSNENKRPGIFINSIAGLEGNEHRPNSSYTLSGEFRKASGDLQAIDVNLQYVENFTEHHAELFLSQNQYDNLGLWTRIDLKTPIKLKDFQSDTNWHSFAITVEYGDKVIFKSIAFDGETFKIEKEAGTNPKEWKDGFAILLETTNQYPNCDPSLAFSGTTQWRNINLIRKDLQ